MTLAEELQSLADAIRRNYIGAMPRPQVVPVERPRYVDSAYKTCCLCGGTEDGTHPWKGFVGTCTCTALRAVIAKAEGNPL